MLFPRLFVNLMCSYFVLITPDRIPVAYLQLVMKLEEASGDIMFDVLLLFQRSGGVTEPPLQDVCCW